ncbi:MAG: hypothetical protein R3254_00885, partial [Thiomicrorhabdus sp.]|nr:hypothetical protein [Thiomicrorhabdus sp.]
MTQSTPTGWTTTQNLMLIFTILLLVNIIGYFSFSSLEKQFNQETITLNSHFTQRTQIVEEIESQLGYGHFAHNLKNLIIYGDNHESAVLKNIQTVRDNLQAYQQLKALDNSEKEAISTMLGFVNQHEEMAKKVLKLKRSGMDIQTIDSQAEVDVSAVTATLNKWKKHLNETWLTQSTTLQNQASSSKLLAIFAILLGIFITTLIAFEWGVRRTLVAPLNKIYENLSQICSPKCRLGKDHRFQADNGNLEVRKLANYLNFMLERIHQQFNELCAIRTTVDQSSANIMLADNDLNITYMNQSILSTLKSVEKDIQQMLPHFEANDLIGKNIDIFHVNPGHQRQLLGQLEETYVAKLTLGELHLNIIVNPIWGENGSRIGFVTEWKDITEAYKLEKMQAEVEENLKVMVSNAARGHIGQQIDVSALDGFIRDLGEQINYMSRAIHEANSNIAHVIQFLSKGDLTQRVEGNYEADLGEMKDAINGSLDTLSKIISQVDVAIRNIAQDIDATTERNTDLSQRIRQQAAALEDT